MKKSSMSKARHARSVTALPSSLAGELPEQVAYRRASDEGRAVTETRYPSLNKRAEALAQSIVNKITELTEEKA